MRRPRVVGTSRFADLACVAALEALGVAAAWISEARISPPGPEPRTPPRSTPNSLARRRALGEILALAATVVSGAFEATAAACDSVFPRAAGAAAPDSCSVGGFSPGATIQAMVWPTGMSAPTVPVIPARIPSAVASTSITALSVSISRSGSPLVTRSPSFFRQAMSLPVSCAISRAGLTTLKAIVFILGRAKLRPSVANSYTLISCAGVDHLQHMFAGRSFRFARGGKRAVDGVIVRAGYQQLFGGEARDNFVSGGRDYDLLFDARGAPAIGGGPERFEREYHARFDGDRMLEGNQAADDGLLPDGEADAVAVLQGEGVFFILETEILRLRPDCGNLGGGAAGADEFDGGIEIIAAALVGVDHGVRGVADREAAVVAGAVSHVGMKNVVVDGIAGTQHAVGKNVRVRVAALAGDCVHRFYVFGTEIGENFADEADSFIFAQAGLHGAIEFVIGGVDHHGRSVEQRNFILRLNDASFRHQRLTVDYGDAFTLQGK